MDEMGTRKEDGLETILHFLDKVNGLGKKLYTFDLHGTLIVPKTSLPVHITDVFINVMKRYGISLLDDFSHIGEKVFHDRVTIVPPEPRYTRAIRALTRLYLSDFIQENSRYYKRALLAFEKERGLTRDHTQRMENVNEAVIELSLGYDLPQGLLKRIANEIHKGITQFSPDWELPDYAVTLLNHARSFQPEPQLAILSNGPRDQVEEAVRHYLSPWFEPWLVFTPSDLHGYSKPSPEAFIGAIVGARCAMARKMMIENEMPAERETIHSSPLGWYDARQKAIKVAQSIIHQDQGLGNQSIDEGITVFCREVGMPQLQPVLAIQYVETHHIGNSLIHDTVPRMSGNPPAVEEWLNKSLGVDRYVKGADGYLKKGE